jgi:hypothetical protein
MGSEDMGMISLTDKERDKFAAYLYQEAEANDILINEMTKLQISKDPVLNHYRLLTASLRIVAAAISFVEKDKA